MQCSGCPSTAGSQAVHNDERARVVVRSVRRRLVGKGSQPASQLGSQAASQEARQAARQPGSEAARQPGKGGGLSSEQCIAGGRAVSKYVAGSPADTYRNSLGTCLESARCSWSHVRLVEQKMSTREAPARAFEGVERGAVRGLSGASADVGLQRPPSTPVLHGIQ
eukprot:6205142-Pleurochrysis_carterae.AAC.1